MKLSSDGYKTFDVDLDGDVNYLINQSPTGANKEVWERPRGYEYGSNRLAREYQIQPIEAFSSAPQMLDPSEYKDAVQYATEQQVMPFFYTYKWRPKGFKYTQNGIGYCWTWSGCGAMMTTWLIEGKDLIYFVPVAMGYLVGWRDRGNYLMDFVKGAREDGLFATTDQRLLNDHTIGRAGESKYPLGGDRQLHLLDEVWDLNSGNMVQQCLTALCAGRSIYIAYNWWGHALELVGVRYNGNTLEWIISNSHNEDDFIILTGNRAIPSEGIVFVSSKSVEASTVGHPLYTGA